MCSPRGQLAAQALRQGLIQSSPPARKGHTMAGAGETERLRDVLTVARLASRGPRHPIQI